MGFLYIKAELFKVFQSVWGINRASHTKKNRVEDDFLGLQALKKNIMLSFRGLRLVSRLYIFAVLNLNKVYLPHVDVELVDSAYVSAGLSWLWHLVQMRSGWRFGFFTG